MEIERFKIIRARLGLTQSEIALKLGVKHGTVRAWECGARNIPKTVELLLRAIMEEK